MRESMVRTTAIGRFILLGLGAVTLGSGVGLVFAHDALVAFVFLAVGLLLMILGAVQHLIYLRSRANWPKEMLLFPDGLELVLNSGEIRAVEWGDPKLDLQVHVRPRRAGEGDDYLLAWGMDSKVQPCSITAEGFERIKQEVVARNLTFRDNRRGHGKRETRIYEIGPAPTKVVKSAADWGP